MKSESHYLYHIHWSLPSQLSREKSLFLTCEILGLPVNTFAAAEKDPVLHRLIKKYQFRCNYLRNKNLFLNFFLHFWNLNEILKILTKKMTFIDFVISKLRTPKTWSDKCLKSPLSEDPSKSNMVNVPNHCWNLHHSIFTIFIEHYKVNWVGKILLFEHAKSWDCLLTHWLPMKSILLLIETT